jgi:hypothetical protein
MTTFNTFAEIVALEVDKLTEADIESLKPMDRSDMIMFHNTVGMDIRNEYELWHEDNPMTAQWAKDQGDNPYLVDGIDHHPNHPDTVSMNILRAIWDSIDRSQS